MTRTDAIAEETRRYVNACDLAAVLWRNNNPTDARQAQRQAHIHLLALGRLRGQTVAPWVRQSDVRIGGDR